MILVTVQDDEEISRPESLLILKEKRMRAPHPFLV